MRIGSGNLEQPEDANRGASQSEHQRRTGRVSLRRKPGVERDGGLKDRALAQAGADRWQARRCRRRREPKEASTAEAGETDRGASRETNRRLSRGVQIPVQARICPLAHSEDESLRRKPRVESPGKPEKQVAARAGTGIDGQAGQLGFDESWQSVFGIDGGSNFRRKPGFDCWPDKNRG